MTLRAKLVAAQVPLALALVLVGVLSAIVTTRLGEQSRLILADNYRSVLAVQRMKDSVEALDTHALFILARRQAESSAEITRDRDAFEAELRVQESNITESGEAELTSRLRADWDDYRRNLADYLALARPEDREAVYFATLRPSFKRVKHAAGEVLGINQDAMVRRAGRAEKRALLFRQFVVAAVGLALALGLFASGWLTTRMLRPLGVVSAAVRRLREGDLRARANIQGKDEIAAVATEVNRMADQLERYRASSLGELLQAQQATQAAIDGLPDPILLLDANGGLQGANRAVTDLLSIDPDRPTTDVFARADPAVRATVDRLRGHVLGGKGAYVPKGFEDVIRTAAGSEGERIFLPRATPIYGESGAVGGVAVVLQDVTRLFRFDEIKNNLVATVAHEFRTPLTSLRMALHMCIEEIAGPLTTKQGDLLFAAREDCERLQLIVDDLLNLARIESGHIDLYKRCVDPETMVNQAAEVHKAAAEQAQITIKTEMLPGLPEVFVDPDRVQLVFSNLLSNAVHYSPAGSEIVIRARPEQPAEPVRDHRLAAPTHVRFEVSDQGPGISPEHREGLFEKFYRVPGSPAGGAGLGLFISRGLVEAHHGMIGVESEPGKGTTFWFTMPTAPRA